MDEAEDLRRAAERERRALSHDIRQPPDRGYRPRQLPADTFARACTKQNWSGRPLHL